MNKDKKFTIRLNNIDKVEELLQETYNLACQSHQAIQNEMNKITATTVVNNLDIEGKEKYAKIMANYFTLQQKATAQKADIAKLMTEIVKFKSSNDSEMDVTKLAKSTLDLDALRKVAQEASKPADKADIERYNIKD